MGFGYFDSSERSDIVFKWKLKMEIRRKLSLLEAHLLCKDYKLTEEETYSLYFSNDFDTSVSALYKDVACVLVGAYIIKLFF